MRFDRSTSPWLWCLALAAAVSLVWLLIDHIGRMRIVAQTTTPDGVELCVVQRWNGWEDPFFNTKFAFHRPGTNWQTFYYDHEDSYWGHSPVTLDTNAGVARFYRRDALAITFDWTNEIYILHRRARTNHGSQWVMPTGWHP